MISGMRGDRSMNSSIGRGDQSPHISTPAKGDATKIDLRANQHDDAAAARSRSESESRDMGDSPAGDPKAEVAAEGASPDAGYLRHIQQHPSEESPAVSHGMPDDIFRDARALASWSNVVSSNIPTSPMRMPSRSSSGETLLTSNTSQPLMSFQYLGGARTRSHSFDVESPPSRNLDKSSSFGYSADDQQIGAGLGFPPSHPGQSSYKDSTLPAMRPSPMHSPMMYPSTPYHDFKPCPSMGSYSSISLGDSLTDKTSPMSSPSLSPHVSPATGPRKQYGEGPPPMTWQLSDATNEFRAEACSPQRRLHSHLPQSIPEHHLHEPAHGPAHHGQYHSYMSPHHGSARPGPMSPPRHLHAASAAGSHHHPMYSRRPGPKSGPSMSQSSSHHRSSTEVLKTLLRKKACLYEPETSFAVSLVTWLVGRRLALSRGYFTRQQLQAGVHSCVAGKIDEGRVTRTKVNRCMQVILNSCFHYIIPRPDGSEECGETFRALFSREAADEEHLLGALPPPWNDLSLQAATDEDSHASLFHDSDDDGGNSLASPGRPQWKESSTASHAGDSLDSGGKQSQASDSLDSGGKRSVLLCFNENIRSAADVFRCHNEFIRDVAHTGNLVLSPEDWRLFFSGNKLYRRRSANADSLQSRYLHLADMHDRMDQEGLSKFRTSWCAKRYDHDHAFCAFAHVDINRGWLRRDPFAHNYKPTMCPCIKPLQGTEDCHVNMCPLGVKCGYSHSKEEIVYHPENYKRHPCRSAPGSCPLGDACPFTHMEVQSHQPHGYGRQGKRHYNDNPSFHRASHQGSKRRAASSSGYASGFGKLPVGSPMLYIDPAPLSEFEKTLLLPGLQAVFRDHSSSIVNSTTNKHPPYEYGLFGYMPAQQKGSTKNTAPNKSVGYMTS